jgi:hypothetical protein
MKFRNGIIIFMSLFITFIVTLGILMQREGSDLVSDDYYAHDRGYQRELKAIQQANHFNNPLKISQTEDSLIFKWNENSTPSQISLYFMRPNNKKFDKTFELNFGKKQHILLPKSLFQLGNYQIDAKYAINGDSCQQHIMLRIK